MEGSLVEIKEKLAEIVGAKYVIDSPDALQAYSQDYSLTPPMMPSYAVHPQSSQEISPIIPLAA